MKVQFASEWFNQGCRAELEQRFEDALLYYSYALKLDAEYAMAYYNRANVLNKQGKLDEAWFNYKRALALDPTLKTALKCA